MRAARSAITAAVAAGVVVPILPGRWKMPAPTPCAIDYALPPQADAWLRHPILGDPSFDSFERAPGNPIVRGSDPFKWPVNVSLLIDPVSGNWYAYVGEYLAGYDFGPGKPVTHCTVYRSRDRGKAWTKVGPIFDDRGFRFEGDAHPSPIAPDVCVVYDGGRYHMSYDWCTDNTTWANASAPGDGADSGAGYAWAEHPEGPFHRALRPILRTSEIQRRNHGSSRYNRVYASSIVRRKNDWLVLTDLDSGSHFAWGQVALTAKDPAGPWSAPVMVAGLEGGTYYPSPVEAFPAFAHDGYVYDPRTSVGANRNFQLIMRAPIEAAHRPEAWTIYQHGSVWHSEWSPDEGCGIWGQTIAGRVDPDGRLHVLFPSRQVEDNCGTISAASRPWDRPLRDRGFTISAHAGRSITVTRAAYADFDLKARVRLRGNAARIGWGYHAPLGAEGRADGRPHPLTWTRHFALELRPTGWRMLSTGDAEPATVLGEGALVTAAIRDVRVAVSAGRATVEIDGARVWEGDAPVRTGPLALLLEPGTNLEVDRFDVRGIPHPATQTWLGSEAVSGAGVAEGSYDRPAGPGWRFGTGIVCRTPHERAKWNFRGRAFRLWSPRGPPYARVQALLDGKPIGTIDLHADAETASAVVLERARLADGFHALVLKADDRPLPLDSLDAEQ